MSKLLERGAASRRKVIEELSTASGRTEAEIAARVGLSKNGVRAILRRLMRSEVVASRRRRLEAAGPGAPPIEYLLTHEVTVQEIERGLEGSAERSASRAGHSKEVCVIVTQGTNDFLLTRSGTILLGFRRALEALARESKTQNLEVLPLAEFDKRFGRAMDHHLGRTTRGSVRTDRYPPFAPRSRGSRSTRRN